MNLGFLGQLFGMAFAVTPFIYTLLKKMNKLENKAIDLIRTVKDNSNRLESLEEQHYKMMMGCNGEQRKMQVTLAILQHRMLYLEEWEQKNNQYIPPQINEDSFL